MEKGDRTNLPQLHGLTSKPSDAWGDHRVPIMPPTNHNPRQVAKGGNPYSGRTANTLQGSHPNYGRTLTESTDFSQHRNAGAQPNKKRKIHGVIAATRSDAGLNNRKGKGKDVLVAPETISDEDLGQPIGRSPSTDDLNLLEVNSRTPQQNSRIQNASASTSTSKFFSANDVPSDPGPSKPKPRPSTSEEPIVIEDDDEIQDFTDDEHAKKRSGSRPPKGTVSKQRALYERSQAPKLNLQAIHNEGQTLQSQKKGPSAKDRMKPKPGAATASLGVTKLVGAAKPKKDRAPMAPIQTSKLHSIPLDGVIVDERVVHTPYKLCWEDQATPRYRIEPVTVMARGETIFFKFSDLDDLQLPKRSKWQSQTTPIVIYFTLASSDKRSNSMYSATVPNRRHIMLRIKRDAPEANASDFIAFFQSLYQERLDTVITSEAQENLWKRSLEIANGQSTVEKADEDIQEITASQATKSTVNTRSANRKSTGTASVASGSTKDPPSSSKDRTRSQSDQGEDMHIEISEDVPVRRSTRQSDSNLKRKRSPSPAQPRKDPEELILVYPPSGPGAINVHNHDLQRLDVGEFLNDTIIEFGLKLWHQEVAESNPQLAEQIHVYSPFFYKKLDQKKKNVEETYETVKRWTSKIDVFNKTYLVVPINENLHWYLAIIYQPALIMDAPPTPPPKRTSARKSGAQKTSSPAQHIATEEGDPLISLDEGEPHKHIGTPSSTGAIVDEVIAPTVLHDHDTHSAPVTDTEETTASEIDLPPVMMRVSSQQTVADREESEVRQLLADIAAPHSKALSISDSLEHVHLEELKTDQSANTASVSLFSDDIEMSSPLTSPEDDVMEIDSAPAPCRANVSPTASDVPLPENRSIEGIHAWNEASTPAQPVAKKGIEPSNFYAKTRAKAKAPKNVYGAKANEKGKQKAEDDILELESDGEHAFEESPNHVFIFILDSLNGNHKRPTTVLTKYLQLEAKERKGISAESIALGKRAHVPNQQNFSDCGCYLLHFAHMFGTNPEKFVKLILNQPTKPTPSEKTSKDWDGEGAHAFRRLFRSRIEEMSEKWKEQKEEQRKLAELSGQTTEVVESDDEVIIEERSPVKPVAKGKKAGSGGKSKASRLRG